MSATVSTGSVGAYMEVYFIRGSAGTAFGAAAASTLGWAATCAVCVLLVAVAITITAVAETGGRRPVPDGDVAAEDDSAGAYPLVDGPSGEREG